MDSSDKMKTLLEQAKEIPKGMNIPTLKSLIEPLKLSCVTDYLDKFEYTEPRQGIFKLMQFPGKTTDEIKEEAKKLGYELATASELAVWAKNEWKKEDWVVALGSIWAGPRGDRCALYLAVDDFDERVLYSVWLGPFGGWFGRWWFLLLASTSDAGALSSSDPLPLDTMSLALRVEKLEKWVEGVRNQLKVKEKRNNGRKKSNND